MAASKTWLQQKRRSLEPIAPDARAAALTVALCLVVGGIVTLVTVWPFLRCGLKGALGREFCRYAVGVGGMYTIFAGIAVVSGSMIGWRSFVRPVAPFGGRGWRWGEGVLVASSAIMIAMLVPTYSCPDGYVLTPVFNWCGDGERLITDPPTNIAWKIAIAVVGIGVGIIVARAIRLPWWIASFVTIAVFAGALGWLLHESVGLAT